MSEVKSIVEENEVLKKSLAEMNENLKGYEKDYDELCQENEDLKAELEALKAEKQIPEAQEEEEAYEDEDEAMEDEEATEEEKEAEETPAESQAKVLAQALRELGLAQPVATKPQAVQLTDEEVLAKFSQITDPKERGEFYAKHRNQIFN